jgi:hypothetical protein
MHLVVYTRSAASVDRRYPLIRLLVRQGNGVSPRLFPYTMCP